jgi:hypothetical protein
MPTILVGLAVGGAALAVYRRRSSLPALLNSRATLALPPGSRSLITSGGSTVQNMLATTASGAARALSTVAELGPGGLAEQARRYVGQVRAQLDVAIAEGKVAAEQRRKELEERLAAAKRDPASARTAF